MNKYTRGALLAGAAAVAGTAVMNGIIRLRAGIMQSSLPGDIGYYDWIHGRVAFYRMGRGAPVLLVHTPNAGGSSWEWRKVFPELANHFTVYALDLLGFGLSEKPDMDYSGALYADLVHDFLLDVIGAPASAVGGNLAAAYLVNVAVRRPEKLERLVLVNPTGCTSHLPPYLERLAEAGLRSPLLGTSIYHGIVSRANIEYELKTHAYFDPTMVTQGMVDVLYTLAHQPDSKHAVSAYATGRLDLPMRMAFADLTQPTMLIWSRDAYYTPLVESADLLYRYPRAALCIIDDCGMLPHDEKAGEFLRLALDFLSEPQIGEKAA